MKAARFYAAGDVRVEEVDAPQDDGKKAIIAVEWCGICGTDLHEYITGPLVIPTAERPHPKTGESLPITMGHEFCGRIVSAPPGSSFVKGQAVMADPRINCTSCHQCTTGADNVCETWGFLGLSGGGGGLSELVAVEPRMLHAIPDSIPLENAALIEPLSVAWHAVRNSKMTSFKSVPVLILGGGPVGVAVLYVLKAWGADRVYVSEPSTKRRSVLESIAEVVMDPLAETVSRRCMELTDGKGVRVVFDCAGIQAALDEGFQSLAFKGTYVNVAGWEVPMVINADLLLFKEPTFTGSLAYTNDDFKAVIQALAEGKFHGVDSMISGRIHLSDVDQKGFKELIDNKDAHVKLLVTPKREWLA